MKQLFNKPTFDLSTPEHQRDFVLEAHNAFDLIHKELDINHAEQEIIAQRIKMMQNFVNDLPSSDSEYSMLTTQIQMDRVELDEIKRRENDLTEQLNKLSQPKTRIKKQQNKK